MDIKKQENNFTIIDANENILGRLGSKIAKRLLHGEEIKLVNCENVFLLGKKHYLVEKYKLKLSNKVIKQGPYYSRSPADMVKRAFRNMLPYKNQRGIEAFKRLKCYNSVPSILLNKEKEVIAESMVNKESAFYYTKMGDISKILGYTKGN